MDIKSKLHICPDTTGNEIAVALEVVEAVRWSPVFRRIHSNWEDILFDNGYSLICHNFQNRFYGRKDNAALWENVDKWNLRE